jgi:4-alpha-glucanotransferase
VPTFCSERHAGLLLPLFSAATRQSWGIGEIPDLVPLARWCRSAALDFVLMLPVNEMAAGHSPYSTLSAMAVDPIFLRLADVPEFAALGGERALTPGQKRTLTGLRKRAAIAYDRVRALKSAALDAAFARFEEEHWARQTPRARDLAAFMERESWWLDDYTLFRALRDRFAGAAWWSWPAPLASREASALREVRRELDREIRHFAYLQWLANSQWTDARGAADPVRFFGDLPFMVGADSADVWANEHGFSRDVTVGTPPDAFSADGQDWGLPAYRWDVMVQQDFGWLRARAQRSVELYDGYRIDHVIGFYRTWVRASDGTAYFTPADESDQRELGRRIIRVFQASGACVVAEDLGTVPDFLRESLDELGVPGYKVFRWERAWKVAGQPFLDPHRYPPTSVATTGTHDTDTVADWWDDALPAEREAVLALPGLRRAAVSGDALSARQAFDGNLRDALLRLLYESRSNLLLLPIQDIFGWRDRINTPATVSDANWTWRLPWPLDTMDARDDARERAQTLRRWALESGRMTTDEREEVRSRAGDDADS